jgi:hypothetical protein
MFPKVIAPFLLSAKYEEMPFSSISNVTWSDTYPETKNLVFWGRTPSNIEHALCSHRPYPSPIFKRLRN